MLGAATDVPPTSPASNKPPVLLNSQTPSLQKNVASWPEAAFRARSGVKRCGTPGISGGGFCIGPTSVAVAAVPPPGAAAECDGGGGGATKALEVGGVAGEGDPGDLSAADHRGCGWLSRAAAAGESYRGSGSVPAAGPLVMVTLLTHRPVAPLPRVRVGSVSVIYPGSLLPGRPQVVSADAAAARPQVAETAYRRSEWGWRLWIRSTGTRECR